METLTKKLLYTDEEIVDKIINDGKATLFEMLYDRYSNKVYRKCLSFTKEESSAEDLTHDVFILVYSKLSNFKKESKFSTWLYAITFNKCVDYSRKKKRIKEDEFSDLSHIEVPDNVEEICTVLIQAKIENLKIVLDKIPAEDKMILLMKYQEDMSIKEICAQLNISESATKMRIKRAKQKCKHIYIKHFIKE